MDINELPDIVLVRIFDWTCNNNKPSSCHYNLQQWIIKVKLLAVCRLWREMAFPSVNKISFIQCSSFSQCKCTDADIDMTYFNSEDFANSFYDPDASSICDSDTSSICDSDASSISATSWNSFNCDSSIGDNTVVRSNLDIIDRHRVFRPKYLHILIKTRRQPKFIIRRLIQEVNHYSTFLSAVERVKLAFSLSDVDHEPSDRPSNIYGMDELGEEFTQLIPSVKHLEFRGCNDDSAVLTFASSVIKEYAHQLTVCVYPQIALKKVNAVSDKLTHVRITRER